MTIHGARQKIHEAALSWPRWISGSGLVDLMEKFIQRGWPGVTAHPHRFGPRLSFDSILMKLASSSRPTTQQEGAAFIEQFIFPTLEKCKKLQAERKILAGGPESGAVALVLIVSVESAQELDDLITSLPVWPRMETTVTPLTTFDNRMESLRPRLGQLKGKA